MLKTSWKVWRASGDERRVLESGSRAEKPNPKRSILPVIVPEEQRRFALEVVRRLRAAGFEAYWAGGCVRDELLHRPPKDYDVATDARPEQIRELFGPKKTLAIGAAFGVITVRGPKKAGMVEVATFRQDAAYSDGRHPDHVTFSSAREDALRRDFTINGLFFDPLEGRVIDFVGGQEDLARRVIRAIGPPGQRFAEDKLRMLRAVRFSAAFGFPLEADTRGGHRPDGRPDRAPSARSGSPWRCAACWSIPAAARRCACCWRRAWPRPCCRRSCPSDDAGRQRLERRWRSLGRLERPGFPLALAALLCEMADASGRPAGLPPLAAVEQGDRAGRLAAGASRGPGRRADEAAGRRSSRCWSPTGSRTCWRFTRRPRRPGPTSVAYCRSLLGAAAGSARSAAAGDRRRPVGPRRAGRSQVPFPSATTSAMPSSTAKFTPEPRRWRMVDRLLRRRTLTDD